MHNLYQSPVVFNAKDHTYKLGKENLSGITSRLGLSTFFIDKYKGIPKSILNAKASFGSFIHEQFEMLNNGIEVMEIDEVKSYKELLAKYKIKPFVSEYLVSDEKQYATMVDMIDGELNLYDHKTTAKLDKEYLSWQLSINKYLFYKQNGIEPNKLFVNHVKDGKCKLVEIEAKTYQEVEDMLYTDKYMADANTPIPDTSHLLPVLQPNDIVTLSDIEQSIYELENTLKTLNKQKEQFINDAKKNMDLYNIDKWETNSFIITRSKDYTRKSFNSADFKESHPELFDAFSKETLVSGGIKIKLK